MLVGISGYIGSGKDTVAKMIQFLTMGNKDPHTWGETKEYGFKEFEERNHSSVCGYWEIKKFAGKLKQIVSLLTGIPIADLEKESIKSSLLSPEWNYKDEWFTGRKLNSIQHISTEPVKQLSVRQLLQRLGTDAMRDKVHPNIHVNGLFADYTSHIEGRITPKLSGGMGGGNTIGVPVWPNWIISDLRFPNELQAIKNRGGVCIRINRLYANAGDLWDLKHESETALDNTKFDYTIQNSGTLEELLEQVRTMLLHFKIIS